MKSIYLSIIILFAVLISMNSVSACIITEENQIAITFKPNSGINMDKLEQYCTKDTCSIDNNSPSPTNPNWAMKTITYKIDYEGYKIIAIARSEKKFQNPEFTTLSLKLLEGDKNINLKLTTSLGLRLLIANDIIYGVSAGDVRDISNIIESGNLVYFKPSSCENTFDVHSGSNTDAGKQGWLLAPGNCMVDDYSDSCPVIGCYKCGNLGFVPGELIVGFKNTTTEESARTLIESLGLNVSSKDIAGWQIGLPSFVVKVPEGEEQKWIQILQGEEIVKNAETNGITALNSLNLLALTLVNAPIAEATTSQKFSSIIYLIIGIVLVAVILILFLIKRKK